MGEAFAEVRVRVRDVDRDRSRVGKLIRSLTRTLIYPTLHSSPNPNSTPNPNQANQSAMAAELRAQVATGESKGKIY